MQQGKGQSSALSCEPSTFAPHAKSPRLGKLLLVVTLAMRRNYWFLTGVFFLLSMRRKF
jgi:hypothetical protein